MSTSNTCAGIHLQNVLIWPEELPPASPRSTRRENAMSFIQIVEMRSRDIEELEALYEKWERATEGTATLRRSILTRDRSDPHQVTVIAFFDSYEAAMQNSRLPETTALAEKAAALAEGPLAFRDLDVLDEHPGTTRVSP
ncbi:hypothetical protein [Geodermatophilus obscurus]|nr:hypothetical protein [Geodermatophilus obscurus]